MSAECTGALNLDRISGSNIPVDIWLKHDDQTGLWVLSADNYMPRRGCLGGPDSYEFFSESRDELVEILKNKILPIYINALAKINAIIKDEEECLYYWD